MNTEKEQFEPKIVGFVCNWCSTSAANVAGTSKIEYPANIRMIKVMCSGSVDPTYVLRALVRGGDGELG